MPTNSPRHPNFLILDVGSSSVRAMLMDAHARPIDGAISRREHQFHTDTDGASTAEAPHLRALLEACIDDILRHPRAKNIRAVGMATFVGNLLGIDENGTPITPVYTYADFQPADDVTFLQTKIDLSASHQRTGCRLHTAYQPARLHWLKRTQPETFNRVNTWLDLATYCYAHWFGRDVPCSYSVASWSGLLNRAALSWDTIWLDELGLSASMFPTLADFSATQSGLSTLYAGRWQALRDVPFYLALGDGAAANIGSGAVSAGNMALTIGTTAALRIIENSVTPPIVPAGLWSYRGAQNQHLIGGATTEGGNIFHWAKNTLNLPDASIIEAHLITAEPDAHGLTFLPLLAGERSPGWRMEATGTLHGLRLSTSPLDIMQAALEGVALRLAAIAHQLARDSVTVYASGGALDNSPAWTQLISDALNHPVHLLAEGEVTARGVGLLLLNHLDGVDFHAMPPQVRAILQPRPKIAERLHHARQRQHHLYTAIGHLME